MEQIQPKRDKGVYSLPFYSVEAVYFHPKIVQEIANRQAGTIGENSSELCRKALSAGVAAVHGETERLSKKAAKKSARLLLENQLPKDEDLFTSETLTLHNKASCVLRQRKNELDTAVSNCEWETILKKCPVKESKAFGTISQKLGFPNLPLYRRAVLQLLRTDETSLQRTRALFGDLYQQLN